MARKISRYEENRILKIAMELEQEGEEWAEKLREDKNCIENDNLILEIYSENKCSIHSAKDLEKIRLRIPFFFSEKENAGSITVPINYSNFPHQ